MTCMVAFGKEYFLLQQAQYKCLGTAYYYILYTGLFVQEMWVNVLLKCAGEFCVLVCGLYVTDLI